MKRPLCLICLILSAILVLIAPKIKSNIDPYTDLDGQYHQYEGTLDDIQYKSADGSITQILYMKGEKNVIVYMKSPESNLKIGQKLRIRGMAYSFSPARNEGMFDSRTYYNAQGYSYGINGATVSGYSASYAHLRNALLTLRRYFSSRIDLLLPQEEASIIKTMLLGQKKEIDEELKDLYMRNGIAHILSISGLHISLIGLGFFKLLKKLGVNHKVGALISSVIILLYGIMSGFSVSSVRAIIMFIISMGGILLGRAYDLLTSVSLAMLLVLIENPLYIYHSGFAFSFGCIFGIAIIVPTLVSPSVSENKLPYVISVLLGSVAMSIVSLPIYFSCYYQLPVYSIILNFLVLPVMSILMAGSFIMLFISCISLTTASPIAYLIIGILRLFKSLASFFDTLPFHYYTPGAPALWQIILFIAVCLMLYCGRKRIPLYKRFLMIIPALILLTLRFGPSFEMCMLDVGQGESLFLRERAQICLPGVSKELTILVDGGSTDIKNVGEYRIIPFLKYKGASVIDAVLISHTDADHISGIAELLDIGLREGINIRCIALPRLDESMKNDGYKALEAKADELTIPVSYISEGWTVSEGYSSNELTLSALWPRAKAAFDDINETCSVFKAEYAGRSILLTGDIDSSVEKQLNLRESGDLIDILKVAHHGSNSSSCEEFLHLVAPKVSLISAGINNQYGHPHLKTLERLDDIGTQTFCTAQNGEITISINRKGQIAVKTFCP